MDVLKIVLGLFVLLLLVGLLAVFGQQALNAACVSVLPIHGEISFEEPSIFSTTPSARTWIQKIKDWEKSASPVLLLDINSPGGSAVASKELYDVLAASNKPVVAYLGEVAASGGYYVASAAKHVIANPNTITGSIGAKAELLNYEQLFQKIGLRQESIQTGRLKDIGAGYRNLTDEERAILQEMIFETYDNFRRDVEQGRKGKLTYAYPAVLDARILTASQALGAGLVDEVGGREKALRKAAEFGGLSSGPSECSLIEENPLEKAFQSFGAGFARAILSLSRVQTFRLVYS